MADVEMVPVHRLRVGDEVQGYGVLTRVAHHSWGTTVSSSRNWFHAPGVLCDMWPLDALVPVVLAPRKWPRVRRARRGVVARLFAAVTGRG